MSNRLVGTVKWFDPVKGYGFLQQDAGADDVFIHISALERAGIQKLTEGQRVSYEIVQSRGGRVAAAELMLE